MKSTSPLGTLVPSENAGLASLYGKTISLNYKLCDWFEPPSRDPELHMDHARPTVQIPGPGQVSPADLKCIQLNIRAGHIIFGSKPLPRFEKNPDVLESHLNMVRGNFKDAVVKDHVLTIIRGNANDGGYNKLEILNLLLDAERRDPNTGKGGRNRPDILKYLQEACDYIRDSEGGISQVQSEESTTVPNGSNIPVKMATVNPKKFLADALKPKTS